MKKKLTALLVTAVLAIAMFARCGKDKGITIAVPNDTTNEEEHCFFWRNLGILH